VRAAVYYNNRDVRLEERPRPTIGAGEILLRIEASGVCGSDLLEWYRVPRAPLVLGHEVAGTVEEVGSGVAGFDVGDRVATTHHVPCNACRYCRSGRHSCCPTLHATSFDPGGFCEFVRLPAVNVERGTLRLPGHVSCDEGTFVEPLACVVRGQRAAGVSCGDAVAVLGSGISGILHVQLARHRGAERIVATDVARFRLDAARRFGASAAIPVGDDLVARALAANEGRRFERVLVCTAARSAIEQALDLVDDGGSVLFFATMPPGEALTLPMNALWKRGIALVFSYAGPPDDMSAALDLIAAGAVDVGSMITHRVGLAETGEAFRLMAASGDSLKVIVEPQR